MRTAFVAITSTIGTLVLGTFMSLFAWLWWSNLTDPLRRANTVTRASYVREGNKVTITEAWGAANIRDQAITPFKAASDRYVEEP